MWDLRMLRISLSTQLWSFKELQRILFSKGYQVSTNYKSLYNYMGENEKMSLFAHIN